MRLYKVRDKSTGLFWVGDFFLDKENMATFNQSGVTFGVYALKEALLQFEVQTSVYNPNGIVDIHFPESWEVVIYDKNLREVGIAKPLDVFEEIHDKV
jgi:hypothetical protein